MELGAPRNLEEVLTDGYIQQQEKSWALRRNFGPVTVSFNEGLTLKSQQGTFGFPAVKVATIRDNWTWEVEVPFDIPELHGTQPMRKELVYAARTLFGNGPAFSIPTADGTTVVVMQDQLSLPLRHAVVMGLRSPFDTRRSLLGYAAARGVAVAENGPTIILKEKDQQVEVTHGRISPMDPRSDAFYLAHEHQLFLEAQQPPRLENNQIRIGDKVYHAVLMAIDGRWVWDTFGPVPPEANRMLNYAIEYGLPEFFGEADVTAAMPFLHMWNKADLPLADGRTGTFLFNMELPPITEEVGQAVLAAPVPEGIDAAAARQYYRKRY